ncbi:MAG: hypothetical protein U0Q07_13755 [Acidimicrobiales bacterium]
MVAPSAASAPAQKKGKGVVIGIVLIVLSFVVFGAGIAVFAVALSGISTDFRTVGSGTSSVQLSAGEHGVYSTRSNFTAPDVSIKGPNGEDVAITNSSSSSTYTVNSDSYNGIGTFNAPSSGTYTVTVTPDSISTGSGFSSSSKSTVAIGPSISALGGTVALALGGIFGGIGLGSVLFIIGVIVLIVGLVRRSKAKNPPTTPYGGYGAPAYPGYPPAQGYAQPQAPTYPQPQPQAPTYPQPQAPTYPQQPPQPPGPPAPGS